METKVTDKIYTCNLSGYSGIASDTPSAHQGRIAVFWWANKVYKVKDWRICGPGVLSIVIVMGSQCFYIVECYIPPTNLNILTQVKQALNKCLKGRTPLLLGISTSICVPLGMREISGSPTGGERTSVGLPTCLDPSFSDPVVTHGGDGCGG